jgi:hypothetical protein
MHPVTPFSKNYFTLSLVSDFLTLPERAQARCVNRQFQRVICQTLQTAETSFQELLKHAIIQNKEINPDPDFRIIIQIKAPFLKKLDLRYPHLNGYAPDSPLLRHLYLLLNTTLFPQVLHLDLGLWFRYPDPDNRQCSYDFGLRPYLNEQRLKSLTTSFPSLTSLDITGADLTHDSEGLFSNLESARRLFPHLQTLLNG